MTCCEITTTLFCLLYQLRILTSRHTLLLCLPLFTYGQCHLFWSHFPHTFFHHTFCGSQCPLFHRLFELWLWLSSPSYAIPVHTALYWQLKPDHKKNNIDWNPSAIASFYMTPRTGWSTIICFQQLKLLSILATQNHLKKYLALEQKSGCVAPQIRNLHTNICFISFSTSMQTTVNYVNSEKASSLVSC